MGSHAVDNEMDIAQQDLEVRRYALGTPDTKNLHGTLSTGQRNDGAKGIKTTMQHYNNTDGGRKGISAFERSNYQTHTI